MNVLQSTTFGKQLKKLHDNQKNALDKAIKEIIKDPMVGDSKKGNLSGLKVYKFQMVNQLILLAYEYHSDENKLILLALGSHENFYRDLKKIT